MLQGAWLHGRRTDTQRCNAEPRSLQVTSLRGGTISGLCSAPLEPVPPMSMARFSPAVGTCPPHPHITPIPKASPCSPGDPSPPARPMCSGSWHFQSLLIHPTAQGLCPRPALSMAQDTARLSGKDGEERTSAPSWCHHGDGRKVPLAKPSKRVLGCTGHLGHR